MLGSSGCSCWSVKVTPASGVVPAARAAAVRDDGSAPGRGRGSRCAGRAARSWGSDGDRLRALVEPLAAVAGPEVRVDAELLRRAYRVPRPGRAGPAGTPRGRSWGTPRTSGSDAARSVPAPGTRTGTPRWRRVSHSAAWSRFSRSAVSRGRCSSPLSVLNRQFDTARATGSRSRARIMVSSPRTRHARSGGLGDLDVAGALLAEEALVGRVREERPAVPVPRHGSTLASDEEHLRLRPGWPRHRDLGVGLEQRLQVGGAAPLAHR